MSPTTITLLFLAFAIISFVLEKIPLGLTATIVALGLNLTGVLETSETFAGYINSNVILCVGMFVVGQALFETGMANKIGGIVTKFAKSERMLIIAIMVIVGVMSGFLSNTGTAAVLIPVVCGIADESGYSRGRLLMPLVFAAALGGNLSIIGAPGNLMGVNALQELGESTSFFMYAPVGIPMLALGILFYATIGFKLLPHGDNASMTQVEKQNNFDEIPSWKQVMSLAVLIVVILAMIFEDQIGIKLQVTACIGACVLVLTRVIPEKEALKSIDLKVAVLFNIKFYCRSHKQRIIHFGMTGRETKSHRHFLVGQKLPVYHIGNGSELSSSGITIISVAILGIIHPLSENNAFRLIEYAQMI